MLRETIPEHSKGEILIVEDTPASLKLLSDLLAEAGYYVRQAPNGELALWTATSRPPELILLDVRMPGIDGFEVCRRMKEHPLLKDVPVIFLSAQYETDDKVRGFQLGGVDFIAKPFQAEEILARTDAHVRLSRAQRALAEERATLEQRVQERTAELARNAESLRLAGQVFDATLDAIFVTDIAGNIVTVNPAFTRVTGYTLGEVLGKPPGILREGFQDKGMYGVLIKSLEANGRWSGEVMNRHKEGATHPGLLSVSAARDGDGALRNYVAVFTDLSERKAEQHLIDFLSTHDALTGLPNRALAAQRFDQAYASARSDGKCVVVMCLDLDRFKNVNDALGQPVGDRTLQAVAAFLGSCVDGHDTITRQGGDEFQVILQDDANLERSIAIAGRILAGMPQQLVVDGHHVHLTASIGIAISPNDGHTLDELMRNADTALVRAKETGRDAYSFFTERMDSEVREKMAILTQMRGAIERGEFAVYYQPQVCLKSGAMVGAEALLRWDNPVLGKVMPSRFIPLAEEFGLINAIGAWVLDTVCAQLRQWKDAGLGAVKVAVNLSARQFEQDATVSLVQDALDRHGIDAACLGLEITEGTVMNDPDRAVATLDRLKQIGVLVSLDDFGTGYSSLGYLKRFPIDTLKIDKTFVDDVTDNPYDAAIALSVISLAHNLHMKVIAEGVETVAQRDFLAAHGCDEMQGYLFSRPVPAGEFAALLARPD